MRMQRFFNLAIATGLVVTAAACEPDTRTRADRDLDESQRTVERGTDRMLEEGKEVGRDVTRDTESAARDVVQGTRELGEDATEGVRDVDGAISSLEDEVRELRDDLRPQGDAETSAMLPPEQDPWENTRPGSPPMPAPDVDQPGISAQTEPVEPSNEPSASPSTAPSTEPSNEPSGAPQTEPTSPGITSPSTSQGSAGDFSSQPSVMGSIEDQEDDLPLPQTEPTELSTLPDEPPVTAEPSTAPTEPIEPPTNLDPSTPPSTPSTMIDPSATTEPSTTLTEPLVTAEPSTTVEPSTIEPATPPMSAMPSSPDGAPPSASTTEPEYPEPASPMAQTEPSPPPTVDTDREFGLQQQNRIATLRGVHATISSQPIVIKAAQDALALSESDRALVDEKIQTLQRRIDETGTLIMTLETTPASNWTARNDVVDDAMRRLEAARDEAWQAVSDAANHVPTSMR